VGDVAVRRATYPDAINGLEITRGHPNGKTYCLHCTSTTSMMQWEKAIGVAIERAKEAASRRAPGVQRSMTTSNLLKKSA